MRKIVLVTDQSVLAEGFRCLLADSASLLLDTGSCEIAGLVNTVERMGVDTVLLDWTREWSPEKLATFCSALPELRVVLVTRDPSPELVYQAQEAGLSGLLDTRCSRAEILSRLERADSEEFAFDGPEGTAVRAAKAVRMTPREGQMVCLLAQGLKNKEIATALGISEGTVKVYLSKLFRKVGARDRFEMALFGLKNMVGHVPDAGEPAGDSVPRSGPRPVGGLSTLVVSEPAATPEQNRVAHGAFPQAATRAEGWPRSSGFRDVAAGRPAMARERFAVRR
jgi:DNA-binding NarL/FixJ family response regulator